MLKKFCCIDCFGKKSIDPDAVDHPSPHRVPIDKNTQEKNHAVSRTTHTESSASLVPNCTEPLTIANIEAGPKPDTEAEAVSQFQAPRETELVSEPIQQGGKRNLWEIAEEQLDNENKEWLQRKSDDSIENVLDSLITETRDKYTEYKKGGLEIRKREGGTFDFRDSAKKVIVFTLQAQELVKGVAGFDPTGHAAAAWSVVSFGLTLIKNDIDRRDAVMAASEFLAWALSYHAIIDSNYRAQNRKSNQGLENALVEVYVAILQYTAEVENARKGNALARAGNSITALIDKPLERLKSVVETKSQTLDKWKDLCRDEAQTRDAEQMLTWIEETVRTLATVESRSRSQEERDILDWISEIGYDDIQHRTQKNRSSGTGSWFLKSLVYIKWRATPGEILWLHGVVGCGKSVLCSTIIDDIESHCKQNPRKTHAYWYFQFSYQDTQRVENMIRSFIRQLCPNPLPESVRDIWEEKSRKNREPNSGQLVQILHDIIRQLPSDVFIIFDALDECPQKSGQKEREQLLDFMEQLLKNHRGKLHLVVTSRPEPDIREKLEKYKCVNLESGLSDDVEIFVDAELETGKLSRWGPDIRNRIKAGLVGVSERRFRWADLQIKRLEECHRKQRIDKALASIPASLEESYRNILEGLEEDDRDDARTILLWLSFSVVPLTLKTIADVVSLPFEEDVVKICTTALVTTSSEDNTIRLAHFSVKEFLLSEDSVKNAGCFHLSAKLAHRTILEKSLSELLDQDKPLNRDDAERQPFLIYAAKYWHNHFEALEESTPTQYPVIQRRIENLFMRPGCYFNWIRLADSNTWRWHTVLEECETAIHRASKMGLMRTVQRLLESGADPMVCYREHRTSEENTYSAAAKRGYLPILEYLLQRSITMPTMVVRTIVKYIDHRQHGTEDLRGIIDLLWYMGALYDKLQDEGNRITSGIIKSATMNPHSGSELLKIFLDRGGEAIVPVTEDVLNSVVSNRVCGGRMLEMLFQRHNGELHFSKIVMESMVFHSTSYPGVVQVFLKHRGKGEVGLDFLVKFAKYANYKAMEALFQIYGDHVDVTEQMLKAAASNDRDGCVISLLLKARDRSTDISKEAFLEAASNFSQGVQIMESLLEECGPDVEMGEEMLIEVVSNSVNGFEILKLLLHRQQAGIVVSERVMVKAALHNRKEMMQLLMDNRGPCILIADEMFCAAAANVWDSDAVMKYLFDLKPDHDISDNVLHSAAGNSTMTEATFSMLLDRFKSPTVPEAVFGAAYGNGKVMKLLLDRFHDRAPIPKIIERMTDASYYNYEDVLQILLDRKLLAIDEKLIEAVAGESKALELLSKHDPNFPITEAIIAKSTGNVASLRIVLNIRGNDILVTKNIMKAAIESRGNERVLSLLFTRLGSKVPIIERMLIYTAKNIDVLRSLPILLRQRRHLDLQVVWEAWWQRSWLKRVRASEILCENDNVEVSEHMVKSLCQHGKDSVLTELLEFATKYKVPVSLKGRTMEMIIESQDVDMIFMVLKCNPHIGITENLFNAVKTKSESDQYFLMWFFHIKMKNDGGN